MTVAIEVQRLGKAYQKYPSGWHRLSVWFGLQGQASVLQQWVLQDINLQIASGQAVAIMGMNGAGKSTLLKLIANTLAPTSGSVRVRGKVIALLELGMGFHSDFTGRENVHLVSQLLGISNQELVALLPQIEAFAEIGDYFDQPFRTYSSGMQIRLAFSVATCQRPDVLIVDEALAVGDSAFQHKCLNLIQSYCEAGTTLILVSHDQSIISRYCQHVILLDQGRVVGEGEPLGIFKQYEALIADHNHGTNRLSNQHLPNPNVSHSGINIETVQLVLCTATDPTPLTKIAVGQAIILGMAIASPHQQTDWCVGFAIKNRFNEVVFSVLNCASTPPDATHWLSQKIRAFEYLTVWSHHFFANLGTGQYTLSIGIAENLEALERDAAWQDQTYFFEVVNLHHPTFEGYAWLDPELKIILEHR